MSNTVPDNSDQTSIPSKRTTLSRVPFVSDKVAQHFDAHCSVDTRFRRAMRVLAALWLQSENIPNAAGDQHGRHLGSYLRADAAEAGKNFISDEVHMLALRELLLREEGALMDEDRLLSCAISSSPAAYNLFGPMAVRLDLASSVFRQLLPDFVHTVEAITFEHSPGRRGNTPGDDRGDRYLQDRSAFDCVARIVTPEGDRGSVFIECKLTEDLRAGPAARWRERYDEAIKEVQLYKNPDSAILRSVACEQLTREHCLAALAVMNDATPRAKFIAIAPRLNRMASAAFQVYANELLPFADDDPKRVEFRHFSLEAMIDAIDLAGDQETADKLWRRYCDFQRVYDAVLAVISPKASSDAPSVLTDASLHADNQKGKRYRASSRTKRAARPAANSDAEELAHG